MTQDFEPNNNGHSSSSPTFVEVDESYWSALLHESNGHYGARRPASGDNNAPSGKPLTLNDSFPDQQGKQEDWDQARQCFSDDQSVELTVSGFNSGGLLVVWNSLRGFVPASQLINFPVDVDEPVRREMLSKRIGQKLNLRIIELDVSARRLIFSERAAQVNPGQRQAILSSLKPGTVCDATITNLCEFGAFADLGGIEGLIHISELSWGRVNHPRDVVGSGQKLQVYIMSIDPAAERIALSIKRLQPDPWQSVEQRFKVGQSIDVTITNVVDFGAFASVEEGLEGLIHISQLAEGQFLHPRNVIHEGDRVQARILNIDGRNRRLGLSLRPLNGSEPKSE